MSERMPKGLMELLVREMMAATLGPSRQDYRQNRVVSGSYLIFRDQMQRLLEK